MEKAPVQYEGVSDWRNIYIVSVFAFVDAFQFSFFVWSFWPFVQQVVIRRHTCYSLNRKLRDVR